MALSPMMQQYMAVKEQNKDSILFFRLGDFYEMFFEDAEIASRELELTLTGRDCGLEERAPMCGVPFHSCEPYIARLVAKGYKVAICEQTELPSQAKGIVRREIVRVITPGTVVEGSMLEEGKNNYLCVLFGEDKQVGATFTDVSTGELNVTAVDISENCTELFATVARYTPSEILYGGNLEGNKEFVRYIRARSNAMISVLGDEAFLNDSAKKIITEHFRVQSVEDLKLTDFGVQTRALGATLSYLNKTQMTVLDNICKINLFLTNQYMSLDASTRRNLELTETMMHKSKKGSLLWVMDKTVTAMGKRHLRRWIEQPLLNISKITLRQNSVAELVEDMALRESVSDALCGIFDIERIMTRVVFGNANPKELKTLEAAFAKLPLLKQSIEAVQSTGLKNIYSSLDTLEDIKKLISDAIVEEPPLTVREGGIIKPGYSEELDEVVKDMAGGKDIICEIEAREKERTGISKLRVGYNRVFGYYIEVTNSYKDQVPADYIRKQTLTNCERYITEELKELEKRVLTAKERSAALEYELFESIRSQIANEHVRIQKTAEAIATLDALLSLSVVAAENNYVCPEICDDGSVTIVNGRHPVVEQLADMPFVPNDTELNMTDSRCMVITGPNMAGKSTYMRQVALIVLLAQVGSFVPAESARISLVDAVFTRVGAADDLATGQSTFMVEMNEVASILANATKNSLLIFDEIGRGTSTFDGMSIARAVIEYAVNKKKIGAKSLFSTHYHELTVLEKELDGIKNYNVAAKKRGDEIIFLRKIVRGGSDDSYGIEVANLAGVPSAVVKRAKEILISLESKKLAMGEKPTYKTSAAYSEQVSLAGEAGAEILDELKMIDVNTLTPIESMQKLYDFVKRAKEL